MDFNLFNIFRRKPKKQELLGKTGDFIVDTTSKTIFEQIQSIKSKIEIKLNQLELSNKFGLEVKKFKEKYQELVNKGDICLLDEQERKISGEIKLVIYNSETYKIELNNFLINLESFEKKNMFLNKLNEYRYDSNNLDLSIEKIIELKREYNSIKNQFDYKKQEEINKIFSKYYYMIIKKEIKNKGTSKLFFKLDSEDLKQINLIFLLELKENIKLGKITNQTLIEKASDNTFEIDDIKYYLDNLKENDVVLKQNDDNLTSKEEVIKTNLDVKRKFVSNKSITPDEFKRITGVNPFPTTRLENLILRKYDISCIIYDNSEFDSINLSYTNAKIDPQKIMYKQIKKCNLEGIDLSNADFTDVWLIGTNLKNTMARIDPQKLYDKSIKNCNLEGLDLSDIDFTGVEITDSVLKNTNAKINPQTIRYKLLVSCNLEGIDLSDVDFSDVYLQDVNLKNTNARLDLQRLKFKSIKNCNLEGLDLSQTDFTNVDITGANLKDTRAKINPQQIYRKNMEKCNLENLDLSDVDFTGVIIDNANLHNTNANIEGAKNVSTESVNSSIEKKNAKMKLVQKSPYNNSKIIIEHQNNIHFNYDINNNLIYNEKNIKNY